MIFFITLFRYFTIVLFFTLHFFSFSQGMQTRERAHCARSVFPFIKKKKKKKKSTCIRKNVFWLKQNFICSDRILTFGIRSKFNLRRDGDLVWPT